MTGQYSHRQFFRQIPNAQLGHYFESREIDLGIALSELKEKDVESMFNAFTALPEAQQAIIEAQFKM